MEVNERIFYLLDETNQTAKQLSDYVGVKPSSISAWKTEGSYPSSKYLIRISEFLNVSIEFLMTGANQNNNILLSHDEKELITTYQSLDNRGKHKVQTTAYEELDRINGIIPQKNLSKEVG